MATLLESLRSHTTVVADTGDFESMRLYRPTDATTNPSLILKAVQQEAYRHLLERCVKAQPDAPTADLVDRLLVSFGREILNIVPGRVSTEIDARLSFNTSATIERARRVIKADSGKRFDPAVVDAFESAFDSLLRIKRHFDGGEVFAAIAASAH